MGYEKESRSFFYDLFCFVIKLQYLLISYAALDNKNKSRFILYCPRFAVPLQKIFNKITKI